MTSHTWSRQPRPARTNGTGASNGTGGGVRVYRARRAVGDPVARLGFFHGLEENHHVWAEVVELLPDDVEAWVFAMPWDGSRGSEWALEREPGVWVERALRLVPVELTVLVAHSFGANVLLDHLHTEARTEGGRRRGLALLSPFYRPAREAFDWSAISYYLNDFHLFLEDGIAVRRGKPLAPEVLQAMGEKVRDRIGAYGWLRFFELFARTPALDLAALSLPCLVIGGERDIASFPADCRSLASALPQASVQILPDCGHFTMIEQPARVAALLAEFLDDLYGAARSDWRVLTAGKEL